MSCPHCAGTCACKSWTTCQAADYRHHGEPEAYPNDDGTLEGEL